MPPAPYRDQIGSLVKRAKRRREDMRTWLLTFEELAHYFHTFRKGFVVDYAPGTDLSQDIWSSFPEQARHNLAAVFVAAAFPKDRYWIGLKPVNRELMELPQVRLWCESAARMMYQVLYDPRVNWTERANELADDASSFGTGIVYIDHDIKNQKLNMRVEWAKNFAFEQDIGGDPTVQYCWSNQTLSDIVKAFTIDSLPNELQRKWKDPECNTEKTYEVLHVIMPNEEFKRLGLGPGRLPFVSLWILTCENHELSRGGYYELPYIVVRWYRRSGEVWGRCDAMVALPDARLMQSVAAALLEITEKQGNPPMQGPVDILRGEIELFPGGFTAFDASGFQFQGDPLRPVQLGDNPAMTHEYLTYLERKIGLHFHADVLSMPEPSGDRKQEDMLVQQQQLAMRLGPIFSRVENEFAPPILERIFSIMYRSKAFSPVPRELEGQRLEYHFDNHISDMRDASEAQRSVNGLGMTAQFQREEMNDNLDWDVALRDIWIKMKVPEKYMKLVEAVAAEREQRQQMQQAAQMAEIAKNAGPGMKSGMEAMQAAQKSGTPGLGQ